MSNVPICWRCKMPTQLSNVPGVWWPTCICHSLSRPADSMKQRFLAAIQESIRHQMARAVAEVAPSREHLSQADVNALQETTDAASALSALARSL